MQKKKTIIKREQVERHITDAITRPIIPIYDWMNDLGLNPSQRDVYAILFDKLRVEPLREIIIHTSDIARRLGMTVSQMNNIKRDLMNAGLIFYRNEGCKTYYSLYQNLLNR